MAAPTAPALLTLRERLAAGPQPLDALDQAVVDSMCDDPDCCY